MQLEKRRVIAECKGVAKSVSLIHNNINYLPSS